MSQLANNNEYFAISPLIIRPNSCAEFGVYLRHENYFVLFNAGGRTFTQDKRQELVNNNVLQVYIANRDRDLYRHYLLDNISSVLDDESIPVAERAQAWTNSATVLGKELFEDNLPGPAFEKRYQRFEKLIESTATFLQSPKSLKHLSSLINKGYETYHHGISTMVSAVTLMQEFEYDEYKTLTCGMGALIHDIGKTAIPAEIINQDPEKLEPDEKDILALHPMVGARTCATFNLPTIATNCILFHHERADGKGYPTKAVSSDLPMHTKIVALANTYDNLTRNQPYRKAMKPFQALKAIMEDDGSTDTILLKKFIELLSRAKIT